MKIILYSILFSMGINQVSIAQMLNFNSLNNKDVSTAYLLSQRKTIKLNQMNGYGTNPNELVDLPAQSQLKESNIAWFKFNICNYCDLAFRIEPLEEKDDLDFVIYEKASNSSPLTILTFSSSGAFYKYGSFEHFCVDNHTGLDETDSDNWGEINPLEGDCISNNGEPNGFAYKIKSLDPNPQYYLAINNFFSSSGFHLFWGGDCEFSGECGQNSKQQFVNTVYTNGIGEVFPNPSFEQISIKINWAEMANATISIVDIYGRSHSIRNVTFQKGNQKFTFDISELPKGYYFLDIAVEGKQPIARKFLKVE